MILRPAVPDVAPAGPGDSTVDRSTVQAYAPTDTTGSPAEPTNTDETANYVTGNTGTVAPTHDQPQSTGNTKATVIPNLSVITNNGTAGGKGGDTGGGTLVDWPSL